jgi:prepilin-type N-terminal cleavage/methylation domain-containing protein
MLSRSGRSSGFTLLEAMTALAILTVGLLGVASGFVSNSWAQEDTKESIVVMRALRRTAEEIRAAPFAEIAAMYSNYRFNVPDVQGARGRVTVFLNEADASPEARLLGLPRDLDGDGVTAASNVAAGYFLLPISIEVNWAGRSGQKRKALQILLAQERS